MASIATDKPAKPPISTHPLFPAIVALWFAALLGLGSLVLPTALLERAVMATGIAAVIPAAAPPFGMTARILIALAFTLAGTIAGLLIARRVARAHSPKPAPRFSPDPVEPITRAPINAHEELGHEGFDGQAPGRRRSLAMKDDEGPNEYLDRAPLPGERDLSWSDPDELIDAGEPLELSAIAEEADDDAADPEAFKPAGYEQEPPARQEFIPSEPDEPESVPVETGTELLPEEAFAPPASSDPESDSAPEPAAEHEPMDARAFSPPSLGRRKQSETAQAHNDVGDLPDDPQLHAERDGKEMAEKDMTEKPTTDWTQTPPGELGLVQLAQRLGSAIEKRREYVAARAAEEPAPQGNIPSGFDVAESGEAALAKAAYFGGGPAAPASEQEDARSEETPPAPPEGSREEPAPETRPDDGESDKQVFRASAPELARKPYQPFAGFGPPQDSSEEDEDEIEELAASLSLPVDRQAARPLFVRPDIDQDSVTSTAEVSAQGADAPQLEEEAPQGYGSLLGIKNPFKDGGEKFVRVDEEEFGPLESDDAFEPARVFPGQAERLRSGSPARGSAPAETDGTRPFDPPRQPAARSEEPTAQRTGSNDTDEMLRKALLNLQRTSGAA